MYCGVPSTDPVRVMETAPAAADTISRCKVQDSRSRDAPRADQEDVVRLQVTMDNLSVRGVQRVEHLAMMFASRSGEASARPPAPSRRHAVEQLHHEIRLPPGVFPCP